MTDTTPTKAQQQLAQEIGSLLARTPMDDETKQAIIERLRAATSDDVAALARWLSHRTHEAESLVAKLVRLQKDNDADWRALEKEQHKDMAAFIDEQVAAAQRETETEELLAKADETDTSI